MSVSCLALSGFAGYAPGRLRHHGQASASPTGRDFEGGELLLTESNPKRPGWADVVPLRQGDAVVLAVNYQPVRSARGFCRANLRHGASRLHKGQGTPWASSSMMPNDYGMCPPPYAMNYRFRVVQPYGK